MAASASGRVLWCPGLNAARASNRSANARNAVNTMRNPLAATEAERQASQPPNGTSTSTSTISFSIGRMGFIMVCAQR